MTAPSPTNDVMRHAIGWDKTKRRDRAKVTAHNAWRNRYCAPVGHDRRRDIAGLVEQGLMFVRNDETFSVTDRGIDAIRAFEGSHGN